MATQKQITLVRNLLALTQSSFPAEAEEAKRKAKELILKYGITKEDMLPPKPPPQQKCPGCPNCQPRGGVIIRMYGWWSVDPGTTTTGSSNG